MHSEAYWEAQRELTAQEQLEEEHLALVNKAREELGMKPLYWLED